MFLVFTDNKPPKKGHSQEIWKQSMIKKKKKKDRLKTEAEPQGWWLSTIWTFWIRKNVRMKVIITVIESNVFKAKSVDMWWRL